MTPQSHPASAVGRALITGGTAGIGFAFAHQLAERGHDLVIVARDQSRLDQVAEQLRAAFRVEVETIAADLVDRVELARIEERLASTESPISLLVNNAGFGLKETFLANDVDAEQAMLDVLVTAVMRLSHAALTAMVARGQGGLINVSSVSAFLPRGSYGAAKSWVNSFGTWAHAEYGPAGVTVMTLCPGFTKTEFHERMEVARDSAPGFMWLDAERLVKDALVDFDKGKAISIPGPQYKAVVAATKLIPASALQAYQSLGRR